MRHASTITETGQVYNIHSSVFICVLGQRGREAAQIDPKTIIKYIKGLKERQQSFLFQIFILKHCSFCLLALARERWERTDCKRERTDRQTDRDNERDRDRSSRTFPPRHITRIHHARKCCANYWLSGLIIEGKT